MEGFYVSIIFIGVVLIVVSLIWIAYDRKKGLDYVQKLEQKKEELIAIIRDAEQMVDELNRFSDYVVTRMDQKSQELFQHMKMAEMQLDAVHPESLSAKAPEVKLESMASEEPVHESGSQNDRMPQFERPQAQQDTGPADKAVENDFEIGGGLTPARRLREVVKLYEMGLSDTEIAKRLKMGKGEIHLILGTRK